MHKDDGKEALIAAALQGQKDFGFAKDGEYNVEYVGETPEGYGLFRKKEGHGGYSYWTNEIPPALCVHDEGLSNLISQFAALEHLKQGKTLWKHIGIVFGYNR